MAESPNTKSPTGRLRVGKIGTSNLVNQETIMKSLAVSLASRVSGSIQESFINQKNSPELFQGSYSERISNLQTKINSQITDLDNRLDSILEKHEKDFLTAYRYHMLKVQKELVTMKQKANENELKTQQESRINDLEKETNKYRSLCVQLRQKCDQQEKRLEQLRQFIDELEDDRKFLDYEIRDSRLQNKMLKITLSKQHNQCEEINILNQTTREEISEFNNLHLSNVNKSHFVQQRTQNILDIQDQQQLIQTTRQFEKSKENQQQHQMSMFQDKATTDMTTTRNFNPGHNISYQTQQQALEQVNFNGSPKKNLFQEGSVVEEEDEETIQQNQQTIKQVNSGIMQSTNNNNNNMFTTFMNKPNTHLDAQETLQDQQTNDEGLMNFQDQDSLNQENLIMQNSLQNDQQKKLKYMSRITHGFKEGAGPSDMKKTFLYNAKFTQQLFDIIEATNKDNKPTAYMVEQLFKDNAQRREDMIQNLRDKLERQKQINQMKEIQVRQQKQLVSQKKESEILVKTFKNCIEAVILDKKDRLNLNNLTKEDLYSSDKKRTLELFVENDNTLSHLLEFISGKLIDQDHSAPQSETSSQKESQQSNQNRRPHYILNNMNQKRNIANSQLSGTGEIKGQDVNKNLNNIQQNQSTINHYNLHIPVKSFSTELQSSLYYSQHQHNRLKQMNISQPTEYDGEYQAIASKNIDPLMMTSSQRDSTNRNQLMDQTHNITSRATLRLAGQASISKSSNRSVTSSQKIM
ncbi:UNKNOWN [Stylonychia lemnae]|uniref:Myosin heavy chain n=1 Tax=Stylonychia lemnae TaxID=5949 RepID=A0A078B2U7_STYLE|nr:UNKNOWN [Stylonychia lemnae]|eukprot:CDW88794.1 UNKNOWN [Stylonychia lemnae]